MKIFVCHMFQTYTQHAVVRAMKKENIQVVERTYYTPEDLYDDAALEDTIRKDVVAAQVDALFSVNYWPIMAKVAKSLGLKYLAWSYDSPQNLPDLRTMDYETNYIFLFDREEVRRYREQGLQTVYHMQLAVDTERMQQVIGQKDDMKWDVSFVGSLYHSTLPMLMSEMSDYEKGYLQAVIKAQQGIYGYYMVDDMLTEKHVASINAEYRRRASELAKQQGKPFVEDQTLQISMAQLSYAIASQVTYLDRVTLLSSLAERRKVGIFTDETKLTPGERMLFEKADLHGWVDYETEMPLVFHQSKININPAFRMIRSGIPLRALDIMGAGGFLLSSFQAELAEHFQNGVEMVMYNSLEDAMNKVQYYLLHKDEREKIAAAGQKKVQEHFRYEQRIQEMLQIAGLE